MLCLENFFFSQENENFVHETMMIIFFHITKHTLISHPYNNFFELEKTLICNKDPEKSIAKKNDDVVDLKLEITNANTMKQ